MNMMISYQELVRTFPNPVDCQLIIVDEGVKPAVERVYTIKNTIDYY